MVLLPRQNLDKVYCNHLIWTEEYLTDKKSLKLILSLLIKRLKYISSPYECWMGGGSEWVFKNHEDILLFTLKCQTQKIYIPHKYSNDTSILYSLLAYYIASFLNTKWHVYDDFSCVATHNTSRALTNQNCYSMDRRESAKITQTKMSFLIS